jgi:hypothetical protein
LSLHPFIPSSLYPFTTSSLSYLSSISPFSNPPHPFQKLPAAFDVVCPNTADMLQLPDKKTKVTLRSLATEICQSRLFNHEGFVGLLKEAIEMLKTGGRWRGMEEGEES